MGKYGYLISKDNLFFAAPSKKSHCKIRNGELRLE
jgi:hypothetical protein